jgi:uncharacterized protein YxeA
MKKILISIIAVTLVSLQAFSTVTLSTSGQNRTVTIAYTASMQTTVNDEIIQE